VVAADKGTATFSDIANAISVKNHFWLGDAFASGGSAGYDHKKMAITARGAWESVKRHFRELGKDIQNQPFTCVGVGDMSGDVFGNGMLMSRHTKLVAAFNHMHIFLDPNPDTEKSFQERERLFQLPRSTWEDYNRDLISHGGGIFSRQSKTIPLSPEMRAMLGTAETSVKPNELMRLLLTLDVDLLFFGGIGTYVKSAQESHQDVGDRANDALRINGKDLRCRVVGEGANLGCTQLGRMEFARLHKGHLNTDFIDNSAGVACSDREVNIKILFNDVCRQKKLTMDERNVLLEKMTPDVAALVLRDNYVQPQAISMTEQLGHKKLDQLIALMKALEHDGLLNRAIEYLPDDALLEEYQAKKEGFSRPEIATLLAYAKIAYYDKILRTTIPDDPFFEQALLAYFPPLLQEQFKVEILRHPLRREIVSTYMVNQIINRTNPSFIDEAMEMTGASLERVVQAFFAVMMVLDLDGLWHIIEGLDNQVANSAQLQAHLDVDRLLRRLTLWMLRYFPMTERITDTVNVLSIGMDSFLTHIHNVLDEPGLLSYKEQVETYTAMGLPSVLAERLSMLLVASSSPDVILIAAETGFSVPEVASLYFKIGNQFYFRTIRELAEKPTLAKTHWERSHAHFMIEELYTYQGNVVEDVLSFAHKSGYKSIERAQDLLDNWAQAHRNILARIQHMMADPMIMGNTDLSMLSVLTRELRLLSGR
jgi:glutamate dehydrogenase